MGKRNIEMLFLDKKILDCILLFSVFASSIVGAEIFGVSLSKVSLLPLELYLLIIFLKKRTFQFQRESRIIVLWYGVILISSFLNLCFTESYLRDYHKILLNNIAQTILFHIPIILMLGSADNMQDRIKRFVLIVAQINCIWAVIQFVSWYVFLFDFNDFVYNHLLHGFLGNKEWTAWSYDMGVLAIRPTGLNHDPAFLSFLLVLGFIFAESKVWRFIFFLGSAVAMSRVGIVSIILISLYNKYLHGLIKIKIKSAVVGVFSVLLFSSVVVFLYNYNENVRFQMDYTFSRFESIFDSNERSVGGTDRHLLYIPASIVTWTAVPLMQKFIGIGPRTGGNAFVQTNAYEGFFQLGPGMKVISWSIECDPAELLLGSGILGFILYYYLLYSFIRKYKCDFQNRTVFFTIIFFGFMYNINFHPLTMLLIAIFSQARTYKRAIGNVV